jgi:hypothetical protein
MGVLMKDTRGITGWCHSLVGLNKKCHIWEEFKDMQ